VDKWRIARLRSDDSGSAIVEFLGMSLLLLVPLVYLVFTLSRIQAGAYGSEFAAREAARGAAVAGVESRESGASVPHALAVAQRRGNAVAVLAAEDFGFDPSRSVETTYACSATPCFSPGSDIVATVEIAVDLPGVPGFVQDWIPLHVTVRSSSAASVDGYASGS
jgi:hypothetical protein